MAWKLSVSYPLPQFTQGKYFATTTTSSGNSLSFSTAHQRLIWLKGDIVKLGPSTNANNIGAIEYRKIIDNWDYGATLDSALQYSYQSDLISGVGSGLAEGWEIDTYTSASIEPLGIAPKGVSSPYYLLGGGGLGGGPTGLFFNGSGTYKFRHRLKKQLLPYVKYRIGFYTKNSGVSSGCYFRLYQSSSTLIASAYSSVYSSWYNRSGTGTTSAPSSQSKVVFDFPSSYSCTGYTALDFPYLTHASFTSGYGGVYTFPVDPISVSKRESSSFSVLRDRFKNPIINGMLDGRPLWNYKLLFHAAPISFVKQLTILREWQEAGNPLLLEPDIDDEYPVQGYMSFSFRYNYWDLTRVGITINFIGV